MTEIREQTKLLLGLCGSISMAVMPGVVMALKALLPEIRITAVMTEMAGAMTPPQTLASYANVPVYRCWSDVTARHVSHIDIVSDQDLLVVCPATANMIGKAANGIADDLLSTVVLAARSHTIFAPSMNSAMWASPSVRRNVDRLRQDGATVLEPSEGVAASGQEVEIGSMPPIRDLSRAILTGLKGKASRP